MSDPKITSVGERTLRWIAQQMEDARMASPEANYTGDLFMNTGLRVGRFGNLVTRLVSSMFDEPAFAVAHVSGGGHRIEALFPADETLPASSAAYMGDSIESQKRIDGLIPDGEPVHVSGPAPQHTPPAQIAGAHVMMNRPVMMPFCQTLTTRIILPPVRCCRP